MPEPGREMDTAEPRRRTSLSWERTAVGSFALAAVILRTGIVYHQLRIAVPAAALLILAGCGELRIAWRRPPDGYVAAVGRAALLVASTSVLVAGAATALAVLVAGA
jgi:hypothetical protein